MWCWGWLKVRMLKWESWELRFHTGNTKHSHVFLLWCWGWWKWGYWSGKVEGSGFTQETLNTRMWLTPEYAERKNMQENGNQNNQHMKNRSCQERYDIKSQTHFHCVQEQKVFMKYLLLASNSFTCLVCESTMVALFAQLEEQTNKQKCILPQNKFKKSCNSFFHFLVVVPLIARNPNCFSVLAVAVPGTFCRNWNLWLAEPNLGKLRLSVSSTELSRDGKTRSRKYLNYFSNRLYRN